MKLLIVTYGLNTIGGVQSWQHLFVHQFLRRGYEITILEMYDYSVSHPDKKFERQWDPRINIIHINGPIVQRGVNPYTNWAAIKVMLNFWAKLRLSKFLKTKGFDSILFPDPNFTFFFFKTALKSNNCFVQFHSSFKRFKTTSKIRYFLIKRRYNSYKKFIFLSKEDMKEAIENGFEKSKVDYMYNFIDEAKFNSLKKQDIKQRKQILIVANLDNPDKQIDHILKAFSMIDRKTTSDWKIKVIGDGEYKEDLMNLCADLQITDNVQFTGKKSNPAQDFFESSFFVLSSAFEGGPLTLFECLFSNLPTVAYECSPFIKEIIIDDHNGYVVEKNNIPKLSMAMRYLMENPKKLESMSLNLNELKDKHSTVSSIDRWEKLLFT